MDDLVIIKEPGSDQTLSINPKPYELRQGLVDGIRALERLWGRTIFLLIQTSAREPETLRYFTENLYNQILDRVRELPKNPIILLDSVGGSPAASFKLANLFKNACGDYSVCILRKAMSGAALFTCGATHLRMGRFAVAGPIDPQIETLDREYSASSLDYLRYQRYAERFFARVTNSTLEVDSDRYSRTDIAHILQVVYQGIRVDDAQFRGSKAEGFIEGILKYTGELLSNKYGRKAKRIAKQLVFGHFDHEAPLIAKQLSLMGLEIETVTDEEQDLLDNIIKHLPDQIAIGSLQPLNLPYKPGESLSSPRPEVWVPPSGRDETDPAPIADEGEEADA